MASYPSVFVREGIGFPCEGRKKNQRVGTPERRKRDILFVVPRGALPSLFFLSLFFDFWGGLQNFPKLLFNWVKKRFEVPEP